MTRLDEPYVLAHPSTVGLSPDGTNELLFVPTSIQRLLGAMTDQAPGPPNQACIHPDASEDDALSYPRLSVSASGDTVHATARSVSSIGNSVRMRFRGRPDLTERQRLIALAANLVLLCGLAALATGTVLPKPSPESIWFYSALLSLLLADLLVEPWYTRPADAIANSTAVLLTALALGTNQFEIPDSTFEAGRIACIAGSGAILAAAVIAIITRREPPRTQRALHRLTFLVASWLGQARIIFWLFFAVTATATFWETPGHLLGVFLFTTLLIHERLVEALIAKLRDSSTAHGTTGSVVTRVAQPRTVFLASARPEHQVVGGTVVRDGQPIGVVVGCSEIDDPMTIEATLGEGMSVTVGEELEIMPPGDESPAILGPADRQTSLEQIVVRGSASRFDEVGLTEGSLVEANVRGQPVLYQIIAAEVESAGPEATPASKRVRIAGRKLGTWDETRHEFHAAEWIPQPGSPVALASAVRTEKFRPEYVGRVPGTDYGAVFDPVAGVTHNTAILGILGIGKTTLATELTWRTLAAGAHVVIIDLTNEYATHFAGLFGPDDQSRLEQEINEEIAPRLDSRDFSGDSAGNKALFRDVMQKRIKEFFESESRLFIINPALIAVSKDARGFRDNYGRAKRLARLTPAEVTAVIAETLLELVSAKGTTDALRACLVLEEAHSLAPEWNSTAQDGEKEAATATARAIMQGRKFGFGAIVVTQRTAMVTKSILNQCNTIFALRVYDQTGTEFLGNFIGSDYAHLLANLRDRHAIFFGKASSCASPLLIELNDRESLAAWRQQIENGLRADTESIRATPTASSA